MLTKISKDWLILEISISLHCVAKCEGQTGCMVGELHG